MLVQRMAKRTVLLLVTPGEHIEINILETSSGHVTLGIDAPQRVKIHKPRPMPERPSDENQ